MKEKIESASVRDQLLANINTKQELIEFLNLYSFSTIIKKSIIKKLSKKSEDLKNAVAELMPIKARTQKEKKDITFKDVKTMFLKLCKGIPESDYQKVAEELTSLITYASSFSEIQKISAELEAIEKEAKKSQKRKEDLQQKKIELEALKASKSTEEAKKAKK